MSKRHDSNLWRRINHVTAIFSKDDWKGDDIFRFSYIAAEHQDSPLFEYCKDYILKLLDDFKPERVAADYRLQKEAGKRSVTDYCARQVFKIAWYMEINLKIHIRKALFVFIRFERNRYYILDVQNIHYGPSDPKLIRRAYVETVNQRDEEYTKTHLKNVMNDAYMEDDKKWKQVQEKQKKLNDIYEEAKKDIGLDLYKEVPVDNRSDLAFAEFHPKLNDMNIKLSDLNEGNVETKGIKQYFKRLYGHHRNPKAHHNNFLLRSNTSKSLQSHPRAEYLTKNSNNEKAKNLILRSDKGEEYHNPFGPDYIQQRKHFETVCQGRPATATGPDHEKKASKAIIKNLIDLKNELQI